MEESGFSLLKVKRVKPRMTRIYTNEIDVTQNAFFQNVPDELI